jgi:hypothetical protein
MNSVKSQESLRLTVIIFIDSRVKEFFYSVKKFKKTHTPPNNLLMITELEKKIKIPLDQWLKFKPLKGKGIISL